MEKKLERDERHKMIAGVCAGLANYFNVDISLVRGIFVVSMILHGVGLIPYIVLWIIMPKRVEYGFGGPGFNPGANFDIPPAGPVDYSVPNNPFNNTSNAMYAPKGKSNAGMVVGIALIAFGAFFFLDNFDLLPDWDFGKLWPVIFVAMGAMLIFSPKNEKPWEHADWNAAHQPETKTEDKTGDTPPTL